MNFENLEYDVDLKKYNTLGLGGKAKYFYTPKSSDELKKNLEIIKSNNIKYLVIGNGSNIVLPDDDFEGIIIYSKGLCEFKLEDDVLTVGSGVALAYVHNKVFKEGYTNFAWAMFIPGYIGGSIYGNAEAHKISISDDLISIDVIKDNEIITLSKSDIDFKYRSSSLKGVIILSAKFKLLKGDINSTLESIEEHKTFRLEKQPIESKSAGSTFRNPSIAPAGKLIDDAGLKGYRIGGAMVSMKHANFLINENNATSDDFVKLVNYVKKEVKDKFDVDLILEAKIINWKEL